MCAVCAHDPIGVVVRALVHRDWIFGPAAPTALTEAVAPQGDAVVPFAPPPAKPGGSAVDYCAICATLSLASALVPPAVPAPPLYSPVSAAPVQTVIAPALSALANIHFQARGPP